MPASQPASPSLPPLNRNLVIATSVVLFHVAALWALQSGLLRRTVEVFVPVAILGDIVNPPMPQVEPPAPAPKPPEPVQEPVVKKLERTPPPAATPCRPFLTFSAVSV